MKQNTRIISQLFHTNFISNVTMN